MLFFYKWHVLKEPVPDFSNPSWMDEPLFHTGLALQDDHLEPFCGSLYAEFLEAVGAGRQEHKYMTTHARNEITNALASCQQLRNATSHARNLHVTRRALQNGQCATIQLINAGFHSPAMREAPTIPRQKYAATNALEALIFPFADDLPEFDDFDPDASTVNMRKSVAGFCSMLKTLRAVLVQDMMVLCDVTFYRRMLQSSAVMTSDIFQSMLFVTSSEYIRESSWESDFLPLAGSVPRDTQLAQVVPSASVSRVDPKPQPHQDRESRPAPYLCQRCMAEVGTAKGGFDNGLATPSTTETEFPEPKRRRTVDISDAASADRLAGLPTV
ncbi:hypothetical protein IWQ57_001817, partial [Coemansia nantahalensis]